MECQVNKNMHFRHLLLFVFNRDRNHAKVTKTSLKIYDVYSYDAMSERMARSWFARSRKGNFDLNHGSRSGRHVIFDEDYLNKRLSR